MKEEGIGLEAIGLIALVGLPYSLKFLWAPLVDRFVPPFLGRRRGWILISQLCLALALAGLAILSSPNYPLLIGLLALLIAFSSATQDIVLDAHRRDTLSDQQLALGSSLFINGYRVGMLLSGAAALALADHLAWRTVYLLIAGLMLVCTIFTFSAPEPEVPQGAPLTLKDAVFKPLQGFFGQSGAWLILAFVLFYKAGDAMASAMTTPFILELGFTKTQIAVVAKTFGIAATFGGALLGGLIMLRMEMLRALLYFGFLQAVSTLGFSALTAYAGNASALTIVIAFENLASGMGTAAFTAWMAANCDRRFSATQYALLTSLASVPRTLMSAPTGYLASHYGWIEFFVICTWKAIPGLILLRSLDLDRIRRSKFA